MPPPMRPGMSDGPASLTQLKLARAELAASLATDEEFETLLSAQAAAQREGRSNQQAQLARFDEAIAAAEAPAE